MKTFKVTLVSILFFLVTCFVAANQDYKEVKIYRDSFGVVHIQAPDMESLFTAWGYAIAQDRLFSLETLRAASQGRAAEIFGPGEDNAFIEFDKLQRTVNVPAKEYLQKEIDSIPCAYRRLLQAYASGINMWIEKVLEKPAELLDYAFIYNGMTTIEPWTQWDVAQTFNWACGGAWQNGINTETLNLAVYDYLVTGFGQENAKKMFDDLMPKNVQDHIPSLPGYPANRTTGVHAKKEKSKITINNKKGIKNACRQARHQNEIRLKVLRKLGIPSKEGSYMFMMGGKMTEGNDSFYFGGPQSEFFYPSRFPETGLHCPEMNVVGISIFGIPAIFIGSTENIAFGVTTNLANLSDVFILTLTGDNYHYIHDGKRKKMKKRREIIKVKGQKAIRFDVYSSVYGPVTAWGQGVAFTLKQSWQGEMMDTFVSMIKLMQSKNNSQFLEACSKINCAVNYGWADDQGNFGYVYCGKIPKTNPQVDLRLPTPGTGEYDWQGYHPFSWNPKGANIQRGYIVNWNNIPTLDYEYNDGYLGYWNSYNRVYRLHKLLNEMDKVTFEDAKTLIKDIATINLHCDYLFPYFEKALKHETDPRLVKALNIVRNWGKYNVDEDDDGFYDGAGYTIWKAWLEEVFTSAFADELGPYFFPHDPYFVYTPFLPNLVIHHLEGESSAVPIQYEGWLNGSTMEQIIRGSLAKALDDLESQYPGLEIEKWLTPVIPHKFDPGFFPGIPGGPVGVRDLHVYMYRGTQDQIIRFSNGRAANSVNINPPGHSGFVHPNGNPSPHFDDQLDLFEDFNGYKPMHIYINDAIQDAKSIETLLVKVCPFMKRQN